MRLARLLGIFDAPLYRSFAVLFRIRVVPRFSLFADAGKVFRPIASLVLAVLFIPATAKARVARGA